MPIELKRRAPRPSDEGREVLKKESALHNTLHTPPLESQTFYDLVEGVIDEHKAKLLMQALYEKAKEGNTTALRLFLEYTVGKTISQPERESPKLNVTRFDERIEKVYGNE